MIKVITFVSRRAGAGTDEFHARWREDHGPLVATNPAAREHLVRYEQNRRKPRDYERADVAHDGVAVQWYDSWDGMLAMFEDPRYAPVRADQEELFDPARMLVVVTEPEYEVITGPNPRPEGVTKLVAALRRRAGTTPEQFRAHWRAIHGPLNRDTPTIARHILRYEQNVARPGQSFDGVTIQWFASTREFFAMASEPDQHVVIEPDEAELLDRDGLVWILTDGEETVVG